MKKQIYLDNAATTKPAAEVVDIMLPYLSDNYGNPSSLYSLGKISKFAIEDARVKVAGLINADPKEIYFTSGGTESDNWVINFVPAHCHIITSKIEHHAILRSCQEAEKRDVDVTYLDVDEYGFVNPADIEAAITNDTVLISIMFANNEIGTIQPIKEIGEIAKKHQVLFHTDAVQAFGHIPINVKEMDIDLLSCSAHKIHGPKGVGALYMRNNISLPPFIIGGQQEFGKRASTENVAGIVGFGVAAELMKNEMYFETNRQRQLIRLLLDLLLDEFHGLKFNGALPSNNRLPNNVNISIDGVRGEELQTLLDMNGVAVSTGSACNSGDANPSHVLKSIGLSDEEANSSIRISISRYTDRDDIVEFVKVLKYCVDQLR